MRLDDGEITWVQKEAMGGVNLHLESAPWAGGRGKWGPLDKERGNQRRRTKAPSPHDLGTVCKRETQKGKLRH